MWQAGCVHAVGRTLRRADGMPARSILPVRFSQLISSSPIPEQWAQRVDQGRVPGALLLSGPEGAELLPTALAMISYLQCENRLAASAAAPADSCGVCEACRQNLQLGHPDVLYSFPVVGTGATAADFMTKWRKEVLAEPNLSHSNWLQAQTNDNKQGNINRDESMRILHHLALARFSNGHKVVLIWGADYLGDESNRLLKAIEEPPADTVILLVTSRFDRILPTITSRCQSLRLPLPKIEEVSAALVAQGSPPEQALSIAYAVGGNIGQARAEARLLGEQATPGPDVAAWLRDCFAGKGVAIVKAAAAMATLTREQQKHFIVRALRFTRELGVAAAGTPRPLMLNAADAVVATKLASLVDWSQIAELASELDHLLLSVERNANGKIAFTASSIRLHQILARRTPASAQSAPLRRAS